MVFVPGGNLKYPWLKDEKIKGGTLADVIHEGYVKPFCIDKREVNGAAFHRAGSRCEIRTPQKCVGHDAGDPVTCVTLDEAECHCRSRSSARLPTAEEWLFAAIGTTGHKFPWGNTWFPWGNSRYEGRPDNGRFGDHFCARELDPNRYAVRAGELVDPDYREFAREGCSEFYKTMDKSPFGVENMGSNVLEITSLKVTTFSMWPHQAPVFGLDHSGQGDSYQHAGDPNDPEASLVSSGHGLPVGNGYAYSMRARKEVGFRCVVAERIQQ
jgi:formylglycine-generating enzyme required for sulfatase activity